MTGILARNRGGKQRIFKLTGPRYQQMKPRLIPLKRSPAIFQAVHSKDISWI